MPEPATNKVRSILLFGPPGAGKGTQGSLIGQIPGFLHHSTGDVFRSLDKTSELGKTFLQYSTKGELVPDELTVKIWRADLDARAERGEVDLANDIVILDGIPRTANQTGLMDEHINVELIIHMVASNEQELVERLTARAAKENRPDDADEAVVRRRLEVYQEQTQPVLDHYPKELIRNVDALGTPAQVLHRVLGMIVEQH